MVSFDYKIKDSMGLHARPVGIMVKASAPYKHTKVTVTHNGASADGKRMFAILGLQVNQGETISVSVEGENEQELADAIRGIFQSENL
ncbi:MAG: HPr family phosphocarrier protein [Firmicutes bacterium HGW-Firmicutes-16]|nr:MAG: HPr family phosphocarrier protein [Firmicutes bacterium HGW-Firmicutes-16]